MYVTVRAPVAVDGGLRPRSTSRSPSIALSASLGALVAEDQGQALVQERHLAEPVRERLEVEVGGVEDLRARPERTVVPVSVLVPSWRIGATGRPRAYSWR